MKLFNNTGDHRTIWPLVLLISLVLSLLHAMSGLSDDRYATDTDSFSWDGHTIRYGDEVVVEGVGESKEFMSLSDEFMTLKANRINGKGTTAALTFFVGSDRIAMKNLPKKVDTLSFRIRGTLTNARAFATSAECFLEARSIEEIGEVHLTLPELDGSLVSLEGAAVQGGLFLHGAGKVRIEGLAEWPKSLLRAKIRAEGKLVKSGDDWLLENARWHPTELLDMIDREVTLDGKVFQTNSDWRFEYGKSTIFLLSEDGPRMKFRDREHG